MAVKKHVEPAFRQAMAPSFSLLRGRAASTLHPAAAVGGRAFQAGTCGGH